MWSRGDVRYLLKRSDAHERLTERRMTLVSGREEWVNGYEYGMFMSPDTCLLLAETMQLHGFIMDDVVSPFIQHLACVRGFREQITNMRSLCWSVPVIKGLLRRPDIHMLLAEKTGFLNGYEYALLNDYELSVEIGFMIRHHEILIHECISYEIFKMSPPNNAKALFTS